MNSHSEDTIATLPGCPCGRGHLTPAEPRGACAAALIRESVVWEIARESNARMGGADFNPGLAATRLGPRRRRAPAAP